MPEFRMPSLGADMEAGTIVEWLVKPGDEVHRGDIVAVVDTDKADVDVEIFDDGIVDEILVPPGERVDVGAPLATITPPAATGTKRPSAKKRAATRAPAAKKAPAARKRPAKKGGTGTKRPAKKGSAGKKASATKTAPAERRPEAEPIAEETPHSPVIRRLARHLGVDLAAVAGTGPNGTVTRADVERAASRAETEMHVSWAAPAVQPERTPEAAERADRQEGMRRAIAALMARSKREIPHYYLGTHVDVTRALVWLERANLERPVPERLLPAVLFLKAVALAARDLPELNGFWIDDRFRPGGGVHLGVAISLRGGGLIAPAIHDADAKDLTTLMGDLRDLANRTRAGRLRSSEMSDPTLTVTNLGDQGVETVYGVIYPPQVALVGIGRVVDRPWASDDMVGVRRVLSLTLAADHRASDGHSGARFLAAVEKHLQEPEHL
jgi:pyruvate dehydrogenase E2 component (dihydrolipoamide acetyltransferase)